MYLMNQEVIKKIKIKNRKRRKKDIINEIKIESINEEIYDGLFELTENNLELHNSDKKLELINNYAVKINGRNTPSTHSSCSSRSSNTDNEEEMNLKVVLILKNQIIHQKMKMKNRFMLKYTNFLLI